MVKDRPSTRVAARRALERVAWGVDNETLVVLKCSSKGLAEAGWPKIRRTLGQCGTA